LDVAHGEMVEKELTAFIERRGKQRRTAERHRRTLKGLIAHHETQAERLCEEGAP
jgi:hypothetical protein